MGEILVFGGLVLLSVWRVLLITHLGAGMKVFSFLAGASLCVLGVVILKRQPKP